MTSSGAAMADRQHAFEQSVAIALHLWDALTLAVTNQWGGPDSEDKRAWFAGVVASQFPDTATGQTQPTTAQQQDEIPDAPYVEELLLQVMVDEFDVTVDDDSAFEVAERIVRLWTQCAEGKLDEAAALRERFDALGRSGGSKLGCVFSRGQDPDQEVDDDDDDDDDCDDSDGGADVEMGDGDDAPQLAPTNGRPQPEVDEDGFTKVVRRRT